MLQNETNITMYFCKFKWQDKYYYTLILNLSALEGGLK